MSRRVTMLVIGAILGVAMPHRVHAQPARLAEHISADFSWTLLSLSGDRTTLDAFRGRVLVINSWATWCEPCVAELQTFQSLRAAIPDSALQFVLVASQRREPVAQFVRRRRLQLPVFLEASAAPTVYAFEAVPTTWIIDRSGRIVFRHRGAMRWDTPAVQAFVRELLDSPDHVTR